MVRQTITCNDIIAVSRASFSKQNFNDTSISDITRELRVSKVAFYHHFAFKFEFELLVTNMRR